MIEFYLLILLTLFFSICTLIELFFFNAYVYNEFEIKELYIEFYKEL